jgi:hypothetical protein
MSELKVWSMRDDDADGLRLTAQQSIGQAVGAIVELLGGLDHARFGLWRDRLA